jgi:hypothetical protein
MDDRRMTLRGWARSRNIPASRAQKALESGRIHRESDGKSAPEKADREWLVNTKSRVDGRVPMLPPHEPRTLTADDLTE